ncbi:lipopolysaccharide biosynthesis protein RfbH [Allorhizobium borbori]|uniref:CDP-6-deoxy-D-xylo-4-hexulose-3-dehydrase n=1 Tax=Allorhizobium borbori TaxID=485907 RepID=A0A7W6P1N8_9HYPH|nr:lipopolysaccharide biosynthesis protein RfbH [Allorhizobium borbori]MBB4104584.1 CDP-6-deoxy-D-xylo-4-hexulose-3-dehydrase [Allorhizobium borbori]
MSFMTIEADPVETFLKEADPARLRDAILAMTRRYAEVAHAPAAFVPDESVIPPSGKVYGASEMELLVDSALDFWLTTGRFNREFEKKLSKFLGVHHVLTVNSGSSANLVALSSLTSPTLGPRALKPGDEVISVAAGFPTTINPLLQYGLVPVFLDIDIPTYNIKAEDIEAAITPKTRAIMLAHTLGNAFNLKEVMRVAKAHDLWVVEDCCDALGTTYDGKLVGSFGDISTLSFYPAHHITMGEGGAVFTRNSFLRRVAESMRDWGRDCWCDPGQDNTCRKRYKWKLGDLPEGYDHKYIYSHAGYNLKITDMQAAVGVAQLDRVEGFIAARKHNFAALTERLSRFEDRMILPRATPGSDPSWFGFPITLREGLPFSREDLLAELNGHKIGTRLLFGGNIIRQPYMKNYNYRVAGDLTNSDIVTERTFWIGLYPGLNEGHFDFVADRFAAFFAKF